MGSKATGWTLAELAGILGAELVGDPDKVVRRPIPAGEADSDGITFAENAKYLQVALSQPVGAVIVPRGTVAEGSTAMLACDSPRLGFFKILSMFAAEPPAEPGIHHTAIVSHSAQIDPSATIGPYVVIEGDASIGPACHVMAHSYVGAGCVIGAGCKLHPRVTLVANVTLSDGCVIQSGAVLGKEGFGFVWDGSRHVRVPQVGRVQIGANVEIGANTCIDRATCGATKIGEGSKIDNLGQIAHNCDLGRHVVLAGQIGLSGSVKMGDNVVAGGQVGVGDHSTIASGVQLAGQTGVTGPLLEPGPYFGTPALPAALAFRVSAAMPKLPELLRRVRALEKALENNSD